MRGILLSVLILIVFSLQSFSQTVKYQVYNPPIPVNGPANWGTDRLISPSEPMGKPSGLFHTTFNSIYVAVPDTNIESGSAGALFVSTDDGVNWAIGGTFQPSFIATKTKMVGRPGSDSIYAFFIWGSILYTVNIVNFNINAFTAYTNICDYDAAISSTGNLYVMIDLSTNNDVRMYGSTNGGTTWTGAVFLSSAGAHPAIFMSATGDTALINYYASPFTPDTLSAQIRSVRYRETAPGILTLTGAFTNPVPAGQTKDQFQGVLYGSKAWIFYTTGVTGSIDLNCIVSNDGGTTFGSPFTIGALPSRDEYWFDAKTNAASGGRVDLIYYSDSLQSGPANNSSDKMYYTYALLSAPGTFLPSAQFSEHPPVWSAKKYVPSLIEFNNTANDLGAIWVGIEGNNRNLYFDRFGDVTGITNGNSNPHAFYLSQNYPNPFNPVTRIDFVIPSVEMRLMASLRIYDILGREVTTLVNGQLKPGTYEAQWDASNYPSGVYYYKLSAGDFTETKRMVLVK